MGQIEKDLQAVKKKIKANKWIGDNYKDFNAMHGVVDNGATWDFEDTLVALLDELENEHKTEIKQPVDASGVPWTGEEKEIIDLYNGNEIKHDVRRFYYNLALKEWFIEYGECCTQIASYCFHVKPKRTLEEIARDIDSCSTTDIGDFLDELHRYFVDDES